MRNTQVTHSSNLNNARSESSIAINPKNVMQMIAGSKKFSDITNYEFTLSISWSHNGGVNWHESAPLNLLPGWSGLSDPAICWDNAGNAYLLALPFVNNPDITPVGIAVYKSVDKGITWSNPNLIHASSGDDKQWIAADKTNGNIYAAWDDGNLMRFARSLDKGATWVGRAGDPIGSVLATDSFSPEINVANNGDIYIFYIAGNAIKFVRSTDNGNFFSAPSVVAAGINTLSAALPSTDGWPHFPGATFRVLSLPTGCAGNNNVIIAAWPDMREGAARIYYRYSTNGGNSWTGSSSGQKLNSDAIPLDFHHFHPQIVSQPNGTIGCAYYEIGPKGNNGKLLIDVCISISSDNAASFSAPSIITDSPWDPSVDAPFSHKDHLVTFIGDYFGLDATDSGFFPLWTDTRTGIQELFVNVPVLPNTINWKRYLGVIFILFGITNDGGGAYIDAEGHLHIVGPGDPGPVLMSMLTAMASYKTAGSMDDRVAGIEMQKLALKSIIKTAQLSLKKLSV